MRIKFKWIISRLFLTVLIAILLIAFLYIIPIAVLTYYEIQITDLVSIGIVLCNLIIVAFISKWLINELVFKYIEQDV